MGGALVGTYALVQDAWSRTFTSGFLVNARGSHDDPNDFEDIIGVVAKGVLTIAISEGFFDPFAKFFLGFFATTADRGEGGQIEFLICDLVDQCS